jgi:NADH-quinone oxidoreductase subunit N
MRQADAEDISALAGLNQRSPLLAAVMTLAMVSLAGIPPLAGFFGKFLLLKAVLEHGAANHGFYCLAGVAIVGVVISMYYYFGVVRAIYWSAEPSDVTGIKIPVIQRLVLYVCIGGMLYLGLFPNRLVRVAGQTTAAPRAPVVTAVHP